MQWPNNAENRERELLQVEQVPVDVFICFAENVENNGDIFLVCIEPCTHRFHCDCCCFLLGESENPGADATECNGAKLFSSC